MMRFGKTGLAIAALTVAMAPLQAAIITGQISGFGSAGVLISQNNVDFQNPVGPPDGTYQAGQNPNNATGSFAGLHNLSGAILDFSATGNAINLANFMTLVNFSFTLDELVPGSNYGGQNAWLFQDLGNGIVNGTMVVRGRVFDSNNPGDTGTFQAVFTTQFQNTTSANLLATLNGGSGALELQSYSFNVRTTSDGVPEPGSWAMMLGGLGLVGAGIARRRQQSAQKS